MRILVTAKYVSGIAAEGGSGRFMNLVANTLFGLGHDVVCSTIPEDHINEKYDLIICSHKEVLKKIKANPAFKICISHGIINDEHFILGADRYISISEEVCAVNKKFGIASEVIPQPIKIGKRTRSQKYLTNILIIRREPVKDDPFAFLADHYRVRYSDLDIPIEDQIKWADLCITLGRGALESMAHGKPVIVADNRGYIGAYGDGYVDETNIDEIARCNFSGRRFRYPITPNWIVKELANYNHFDGDFLYNYVRDTHKASQIVSQYIDDRIQQEIIKKQGVSVAFGVLVNDPHQLNRVFQQSEIDPSIPAHTIKMPETACKGLNKLLAIIEGDGHDIAVLAHQDMYFRAGWVDQMKQKVAELPESWVVAGIIGKDESGEICGKLHDMRIPLHFVTDHDFPEPASCFDECCIIVNLKKGFRFDEDHPGFDLYGTQCVCMAHEMGGTAWLIDAFAEHYCTRSFDWFPGKDFEDCFKWLHKRFPPKVARRIDSTVLSTDSENGKPRYDIEMGPVTACG